MLKNLFKILVLFFRYKIMKNMTLLKMLQEIMELDNPIAEANKKLRNTYMIVNGEIALVSDFNIETNQIFINNGKNVESVIAKSLKVWLPDAGLYQSDIGNLLLVSKIPKRQWSKSFSGEYYKVEQVGQIGFRHRKYSHSLQLYNSILDKEPLDFGVDSCGDIYYENELVGSVVDSKSIMCHNPNYEQELSDWCKLL